MSKPDTNAVDKVVEVERRWVQAHRELDVEAIEQILDEDYLQIQSDGTVIGKAEAVQSYQSGKRHWDHAKSDQYRIIIHGDIAILVGRWKCRGINDGERFDYTARFMAIYIRRDGVWKLLADQSTPLAE